MSQEVNRSFQAQSVSALVLHQEVLKYEDERSEVVIGRVVSYQSVSALWLRTSETHMVLEAVAAGLWTPGG